jgi:hypothetical protein
LQSPPCRPGPAANCHRRPSGPPGSGPAACFSSLRPPPAARD